MDAERVTSTESEVPVVDLGQSDRRQVLREIDVACRDWGFFQVIRHGVPADLLDAVRAGTHEFFALPAPDKQAIRRTAINAWGYYDQELTKNRRDWKEIFDTGPEIHSGALAGFRPQWPARLPRFRPVMEAFFLACEQVALDVVRAISENLGMPADRLDAAFAPEHTSFLRLNHYPVCADPAPPDAELFPAQGQLGIHHHTDSGAVTVLLQDELPGLQVLKSGRWHLVQPLEGALVINIGDVVQVWSNDRYAAALHRVLANSQTARYSAPFFFNPAMDAVYAPLPGACDAAHPPRYRPIDWGEFRAARAAGDYADLGEEIQIDHYRVA
jgi:isopenicillin N synthase-like dioxygenase